MSVASIKTAIAKVLSDNFPDDIKTIYPNYVRTIMQQATPAVIIWPIGPTLESRIAGGSDVSPFGVKQEIHQIDVHIIVLDPDPEHGTQVLEDLRNRIQVLFRTMPSLLGLADVPTENSKIMQFAERMKVSTPPPTTNQFKAALNCHIVVTVEEAFNA